MPPSETMFIIVWSGGYEAPSYTAKRTEAEAWVQAKMWAKDIDVEGGDTVDVLRLDLKTLAMERLGYVLRGPQTTASMTPYEDYISHSFLGRIQYRLMWHIVSWFEKKEDNPIRPWKWNKENNG